MIFLKIIKIFVDFLDCLTKRKKDLIVEEQPPIEKKMETLESTLKLSHDWAQKRITYLSETNNDRDAISLIREFEEWFDPDIEEHDIISINFLSEKEDT